MGSLTQPAELPQGEIFPKFGLSVNANCFRQGVAKSDLMYLWRVLPQKHIWKSFRHEFQ